MRGLKILVIVMGVMLVAGVAGLVVAIATRLAHRAPAPAAAFSAPPDHAARTARRSRR